MQIIALLCHDDFSYSELEKGLTKTTPKMLSKELKDLEINGLVERKVYDSIPVKVSYKLADYGYTLIPLIIEITKWGQQHREYLKRNDESTTMYKNNSRDSSEIRGSSPLQLSCNLTGKYHAFGYYSYTDRYGTAESI